MLNPEYKICERELEKERFRMLFAEGDMITLLECALTMVDEKRWLINEIKHLRELIKNPPW